MNYPELKYSFLIMTTLVFVGCATGTKRVLTGIGIGGAVGAVGGATFSPNDESRGLNALVFGLSGAVMGGLIGALTDTNPGAPSTAQTLKDRDQEREHLNPKDYQIENSKSLPEFVKERLQPILVEEYTHQDSVDEDGSLHEPHKVYRIKRNGELFSRPNSKNTNQQDGLKAKKRGN